MSKIGKGILGKLIGSDKNCCCVSSISIVSIRKIKVKDKDMEIAGLDEEFENYSEGKTPENLNREEIIRNLEKINVIPEEEAETLKAAILKEYRIYWLEKEE